MCWLVFNQLLRLENNNDETADRKDLWIHITLYVLGDYWEEVLKECQVLVLTFMFVVFLKCSKICNLKSQVF
jgi:hypothetical protein